MSTTDTTGEVTTPEPSLPQRLVAEAIGTFVLVLFGCGAAVLTDDLFATAAAFGLAVGVMIYAVGRVSGGHFNPAVSVGAALAGRISWIQAAAYAGMQVLGAILGATTLFVMLQGINGYDHGDPIGANAFGDAAFSGTLASNTSAWGALVVELVLTALFVLVILAVTDERNEHPALAPLAIGGALTAVHLVGINLTGTSVNPARSIGPALFAGSWDPVLQLWVFILAPILGALIAAGLYTLVFGSAADPVPGSGLRWPAAGAAAVPGYGAPDQFQQQWNQDQPTGWANPPSHPGQPGQPAQQWGAAPVPPTPSPPGPPQGWTHPAPQPPPSPQTPPPDAPSPQQPHQWDAPQQYGTPDPQGWDDGEDGHTQIRPHDSGPS